jgi:hypothetical protein
MATLGGKQQIVTFKAEEALVEAMEDIPNRSEFIRSAILAALNGVCPLCHVTGVFIKHKQLHWQDFSRTHSVERCHECDEGKLVCAADRD